MPKEYIFIVLLISDIFVSSAVRPLTAAMRVCTGVCVTVTAARAVRVRGKWTPAGSTTTVTSSVMTDSRKMKGLCPK